jgi:hypothetical protein
MCSTGGSDISDILGLAGGATKAVGAYQSSQGQKASLDYQASVASNNAIIAQDNGQIAVGNQELKATQIKSQQVANMAANGVDLGTGSARDVLKSTDMMTQRDADQIQTNALREAWGYTTQAADDTSNAKALRSMSDSVNPFSSAVTSMLGTATQVAPAMISLSKTKTGNKLLGDT